MKTIDLLCYAQEYLEEKVFEELTKLKSSFDATIRCHLIEHIEHLAEIYSFIGEQIAADEESVMPMEFEVG